MCLSPIKLKDGTHAACRHCKLCLSNRVNDLVGRCIAEQAVSEATLAVTLTYAADSPNVAVLCYEDVQKFIRAMRDDGLSVRYIAAGEYGTLKGRAHWHIVLFFRGEVPEVKLESRVHWKYWPHGFVYFQQPDYRGLKYAVKYALKDSMSEGWVRALSMSKKPPLGHAFFMNMADDMVSKRLAFHSPEYSFLHARGSNGLPRKFWLQGRMRELFLDRYKTMWRMQYGEDPPFTEYYLEQYEDKIERRREDIEDPLAFARSIKKSSTNAYLALGDGVPGGIISVTVYEDIPGGVARLVIGGDEWTIESGNGESVVARLQLIGLSLSSAKLVCLWLLEKWGLPLETWLLPDRNV